MNKNMYIILVAVCVLFLLACDPTGGNEPVKIIDGGKVITADIKSTSFLDSTKTIIKTDRGIFIVYGQPSVMLGEAATIQIYKDGVRYFCLESWPYCKRLAGATMGARPKWRAINE